MSVVWSPRALERAGEIADYIAERDREAALAWVDELFATVLVLDKMPRSGRVVPELGEESVREKIWRGYRIVYQVGQDDVEILTVIHFRQQFPEKEIP